MNPSVVECVDHVQNACCCNIMYIYTNSHNLRVKGLVTVVSREFIIAYA